MNISSYIQDGHLDKATPANAICLIYLAVTSQISSQFGKLVQVEKAILNVVADNLAPMLKNFGCPRDPNSGQSVSGDPSVGTIS